MCVWGKPVDIIKKLNEMTDFSIEEKIELFMVSQFFFFCIPSNFQLLHYNRNITGDGI
jgi:hypothetical protein